MVLFIKTVQTSVHNLDTWICFFSLLNLSAYLRSQYTHYSLCALQPIEDEMIYLLIVHKWLVCFIATHQTKNIMSTYQQTVIFLLKRMVGHCTLFDLITDFFFRPLSGPREPSKDAIGHNVVNDNAGWCWWWWWWRCSRTLRQCLIYVCFDWTQFSGCQHIYIYYKFPLFPSSVTDLVWEMWLCVVMVHSGRWLCCFKWRP